MKTQTATAEVEVNFKEGKRTIKMELMEPHQIEECKEGKVVVLNLKNGEKYTGIFKGVDGDYIVLGALSGYTSLGFKVDWLFGYFEELK